MLCGIVENFPQKQWNRGRGAVADGERSAVFHIALKCPVKSAGHRVLKKIEENLKKGVDKGGGICYITQAVREGSGTTESGAGGSPKALKIFLKKVLTKPRKPAILSLVPLRRRAPCKLNNVTKCKAI